MSTYQFLKTLALSLVFLRLFMGGPSHAKGATLLGPSPYLAFDNSLPGAGTAISPFSGLSFSYFHLETFEDHLLNTPGVSITASLGSGVTSVVFGPSIHDSVDADDGVIDGSGLNGDTFFSPSGLTGIEFIFNAGVLGALPTHVGIVWTDGAGQVTFRAFGPGHVLLGTIGPVSESGFPDGNINGQTAEDRFFGVFNAGGISSIVISNSDGEFDRAIEVDHLQYGLAASTDAVPEPAAFAIWSLLGLVAVGGFWRRRGRTAAA